MESSFGLVTIFIVRSGTVALSILLYLRAIPPRDRHAAKLTLIVAAVSGSGRRSGLGNAPRVRPGRHRGWLGALPK
jgi:hypothetical protein